MSARVVVIDELKRTHPLGSRVTPNDTHSFVGLPHLTLLANYFKTEVVLVSGLVDTTGTAVICGMFHSYALIQVVGQGSNVKQRVYIMHLANALFEPVVFKST